MKINKKVLIPIFTTAMGLSAIGGVAGAVAWYQYNSRVSASFVGASVADTGILQIGHKESPDSEISWGRDFFAGGDAAKLVPVTFGAVNPDGTLPEKAYAYPQSGCGEGYVGHDYIENEKVDHKIEGWVEAEEGKQYYQFEVYLEAYQTDSSKKEGYKLVERDVYLSDLILKSVEDDKEAEEALRVHIDVEGQEKIIYSKNAHDENNKLALFGGLDLDRNGHNDQYHKSLFNDSLRAYGVNDQGEAIHSENEEVIYGEKDQYQVTKSLEAVKKAREDDGKMSEELDKRILRTRSDKPVKLTITVWLEGWEVLNTGELDDNDDPIKSNIWNPHYSAGTEVQLGLQFDTGKFREDDLTDQADPYVLTFLANNGTDKKEEFPCQRGESFILPECEFTGPINKRFEGWVVNGEVKAAGEEITPAADMEIEAYWGLIPVVTFNKGNDAADGEMANGLATNVLGYELPACEFTLAKHSFIGWMIGNDSQNLKQPGEKVILNQDVTVTAMWKHDDCIVSFVLVDAPSGATIADKAIEYDSEFDLTSIESEVPVGKQIKSWKVGDDTYDHNSANLVIENIQEDIAITVYLEPVKCSITYDLNGGSHNGDPLTEQCEYGSSFAVPTADNFTGPAGEELDCWLCNNVEYAPGQSIPNVKGDITLKAIWKNI